MFAARRHCHAPRPEAPDGQFLERGEGGTKKESDLDSILSILTSTQTL